MHRRRRRVKPARTKFIQISLATNEMSPGPIMVHGLGPFLIQDVALSHMKMMPIPSQDTEGSIQLMKGLIAHCDNLRTIAMQMLQMRRQGFEIHPFAVK